ncbi:MAG: ABC-type transport auxiliary lipoprotein family protein [Pseudomonadota bacterium]
MVKVKAFAALVLAASATACVSVLPAQEVPKALFRLDPITPVDGLTTNVVVREPTSTRVFGGQGMVVEGADDGLRLIGGVEWAGRLTRLMQVGLVDALSGGEDAIAVTELSGAPGGREVVWRISDMTIMGDQAVCALDITILDGRTREPIADGDVRREEPVRGTNAPARAQALSAVGTACVEAAAEFIVDVNS